LTVQASAPAPADVPNPKKELGFRLIIVYKLAKTIFAYGVAALLWGLILSGEAGRVADFARVVRHHLTAAWTLSLVDALVDAADKRHIEVLATALSLDGSFTLFEWYALRTGRSWGSWVVVLATASLVPFEVAAIVRHGSIGRIVLLFVNVAIVAYLALRSLRKHGTPWAKKAPP
jgi:uncharacterized membrane protein (DUF2068 family)